MQSVATITSLKGHSRGIIGTDNYHWRIGIILWWEWDGRRSRPLTSILTYLLTLESTRHLELFCQVYVVSIIITSVAYLICRCVKKYLSQSYCLTLMLLVDNLTIQNDPKKLKNDWYSGIWVLPWEYSEWTIDWIAMWQGLGCFSFAVFLSFGRK